MSADAPQPSPARPWWRNVFVLAFIGGAVILTVLPVLQRRLLRAPPPVTRLASWTLPTLGGGAIGSDALRGKVWLGLIADEPCDSSCRTRVESFGRALPHFDDLAAHVELVTFLSQSAGDALRDLATNARWHFASAPAPTLAPVLEALRQGFTEWSSLTPGPTLTEFTGMYAIAIVDQEGQLRGFWRDDEGGRGNAINAARLLARYGTAP